VADSDSYLKWAAGLLDELPGGWATRLTVVRTPIAPSPDQIRTAVSGTRSAGAAEPPPVLPARLLRRTAERMRPDIVLVACTGPVVDVLVAEVLGGLRPRPVFVTGLPGIAVPATEKAWLYRSGCDLFVVHSGREAAEFTRLGKDLGVQGSVALARLPYLDRGVRRGEPGAAGGTRDKVIFATQAKVPKRRHERERILLSLAELAAARPDLEVVVKLRARGGERQTHHERHPYERLWRALADAGRVRGDLLTFAAGAMHEHLARAVGFVTVSSTAALEAIQHEVPLLILSDFGVSAEMINVVFEDSGCLGTLDDLAAGRFRTPDEDWCRANYFHDPAASDLVARITALAEQARAGLLAPARSLLDGREHAAARRRARLRLELPPRVLRVGYRARRRVRRYLTVRG
jgi:Capsule polysaccharide export protein